MTQIRKISVQFWVVYLENSSILYKLYQEFFYENLWKVSFSTFLHVFQQFHMFDDDERIIPSLFFRQKLSSKLQSLMKNLFYHICSSQTAFLEINAVIFQNWARPKIRSLLGLEEGVRASAQETLTKFLSATTRFISSDSNCTKLTCWFIRFI